MDISTYWTWRSYLFHYVGYINPPGGSGSAPATPSSWGGPGRILTRCWATSAGSAALLRAPLLISRGRSQPPYGGNSFVSCMYRQSHSSCHNLKLMTIGEGWNIDQLLNETSTVQHNAHITDNYCFRLLSNKDFKTVGPFLPARPEGLCHSWTETPAHLLPERGTFEDEGRFLYGAFTLSLCAVFLYRLAPWTL